MGIDNVGAGRYRRLLQGTIFQCSSVAISNTGMNYSAVAGGIVGRAAEDAIVDSCNNYGTVGSQKNINYAGGIVGVACENAVIRYCTNGNEGAVNGVQGVGGIVGLLTDYAQVRLCENSSADQGESRVGGIVGWVCLDKLHFRQRAGRHHHERAEQGAVSGSSFPAMNYGMGGIVGYIDTRQQHRPHRPLHPSYAYNTGSVTDNGSTTAQGVGGIVGDWHGGGSGMCRVRLPICCGAWWTWRIPTTRRGRVSCVMPAFTMNGDSWDKVAATARLLVKLIRPGDGSTESMARAEYRYNGIVLSYIERIELADGDADALVQEW